MSLLIKLLFTYYSYYLVWDILQSNTYLQQPKLPVSSDVEGPRPEVFAIYKGPRPVSIRIRRALIVTAWNNTFKWVIGDGYGLQHQSNGFKSCLNTQWARCNGFCDLGWSILTVHRWYVQFERVFTRVVTSTLRWTNWSEYGELRKVMGIGMLLR